MSRINAHYCDLPGSYLFAEIARRIQEHTAANPGKRLIRLGIGDVTAPLPPAIISALNQAVAEQATPEGFRGYGPEQGYSFLRKAIAAEAYPGLGIDEEAIFIGDGTKEDLGNFQELFDLSCRVAITDPVYPVYADSNVMAGRAGPPDALGRFSGITYLPCTAENGFVPDLPGERPDIIYLCYPNNPTGAVLTREQLALWVAYAREHDCLIFFDAAYEAYIADPGIPHSIYEIEGARDLAVEFRSYSKTAGFTGLRCGFVVIPPAVRGLGPDGGPVLLRDLWLRRQTTKYNGCPYIIQRAAEATHTPEGQRQTRAIIAGYMENARRIRAGFQSLGLTVSGGTNAPYVWVKLPPGMDSWKFFDLLLNRFGIAGTPGAGFGPSGEGHLRLTGFGTAADTEEAMERLKGLKL
jgi:LL-diaminopimelate aminotransferase